MKRRDFLASLACLVGAGSFADITVLAKELHRVKISKPDARLFTVPGSLWMKRVGSGEEIALRFRRPDGYNDPDVLYALSWFFRDVKNKDGAVWVDPRLFELLSFMQYGISATHGKPTVIRLNSGYRASGRNAKIEGAAKNSFHPKGMAGDIVFPGVKTDLVGAVAKHYNAGGVGFYPEFLHVDVGNRRQWRG